MINKSHSELSTAAIKAMRRAVKNALNENERLGVPSYVLKQTRIEKLKTLKKVKRAG